MDDLKRQRAVRKGLLTRHRSTLDRYMKEDDYAGVTELLSQMKIIFTELEVLHFQVFDLSEEKDHSKQNAWFDEVFDTYMDKLKEAKAWLEARVVSPPPAVHIQKSVESSELLYVLNLPKIEIPVFTGKAREYQTFMAIFDDLIDSKIADPQVKLTRLVQYCEGAAGEAISKCIIVGGSQGYTQAREILRDRFGNAHLIVQTLLKDLRDGRPAIRPNDLMQLADDLQMTCSVLRKLDMFSEINNQETILNVLKRCHNHVRTKWRKRALDTKENTGKYPDFDAFTKFMIRMSKDSIDPLYGYETRQGKSVKSSTSCNVVAGRNVPKLRSNLCYVCHKGHPLKDCNQVKAMSPNERRQVFMTNRLCFNCANPSHLARDCVNKARCTIPGCGRKHHTLIHGCSRAFSVASLSPSSPGTLQENISNNMCNTASSGVYLPIVEIRIGNCKAAALLDSGSTHSLISQNLVDRLGLEGTPITCNLSTINSVSSVRSKMVSFDVSDVYGRNKSKINGAFVVERIPAYSPAYSFMKDKYPYLRGIDIKSSRPSTRADLIIGVDHAHILAPLDIRRDRSNANLPYAVLTRLGWVLYGNVSRGDINHQMSINFLKIDQSPNDLQNLWELEKSDESSVSMSIQDKKVMQLWDDQTSFSDGHYVVPIPWKDKNMELPNNYCMAKKRLDSNIKKLQRTGMVKLYDVNLNKMLTDGYAEKVTDTELSNEMSRIWYLPHHAVTSASKPGKVRIVFDCAAQYAGISLNSLCFQGPDLTNQLLHVLLRFRQFRYAVMADVEAMYHQVRIPIGDRDCFRFLWTDNDEDVTYRMTSHLFGGVWCSASSTYAMRRTVRDFPCSEVARDTVLRSFYVDDMLRSVNSRDEALEVVRDTKDVLSRGGFRLAKFIANDLSLLSGVDDADITQKVRDITPDYLSRALGVGWDTQSDVFLYSFNSIDSPGVVTKRSVLSKVASMYDPLGLLAPIIVSGRMIFQKLTKLKQDWDDPIPPALEREWTEWLRSLNDISYITFPRCVIPPAYADGAIQLHFFCDASTSAYGSVCYIRAVNKFGNIHVSLLSSKVRLAPVKPTTVPRLELCAAVLAVKMEGIIRSELDISLLPSVFWVDSQIVLSYIQNESLRTRVFVANRVSFIHQSTEASQWNYIPSAQNAADILSRGCTCDSLPNTWKTGPIFLHSHRSEWGDFNAHIPTCSPLDLELKCSDDDRHIMQVTAAIDDHPLDRLIDYYSDYYRLRKALSWLLRVVRSCKSKSTLNTKPITASELGQAERILVGHVQYVAYPNEISDLKAGRPLNKSSTILALGPVLMNDLLVVGGRLKHAKIPHDSRFPYILPSGNRLSEIILMECHGSTHLGTEWVLGKVRTKYWIPKARNKLKHIKHQCIVCKKLYGKPMSQRMADLPSERCSPTQAAFQHIGIDCFGPFYVKVGRAEVKRYGCIYTCFATRAVHLEVLMGLDTQSFLNGFVRFCARRGYPLSVKSDNGTNLVGGRTELSKALKSLGRADVIEFASRKEIDWTFNPPLASHHGGVWERMIRTVRRVLLSVLNPRVHLTDEVLQTTFCEVENVVNSRPLMKCSDDPSDDAPLTPNHFLLLQGNFPYPWGKFISADSLRKRWCRVQELVTSFWQRWASRYLPELQKRQKWGAACPNLKVGDLVMLVNENTPRGLWPLGLVESLNYSSDGLVRSAKVRTKTTVLSRPVTKIVLLEQAM